MSDKLHLAGIDIGSNAVRLLIKCLNQGETSERFTKVQLIRIPIRLGNDAFTKGYIGEKQVQKLITLMEAFRGIMDVYDVQDYRAYATSAMRDARNGSEVVALILEKTGISINIVTGKEEAELVCCELMNSSQIDTSASFIHVDIGGGSTEMNLIVSGKLIESRSFDVGTVRQLNGMVTEREMASLKSYLSEIRLAYPEIRVIGSGGNINKLLKIGGHNTVLPYDSLRSIYNELVQYSTEERMIRFALKPDRSEVIVPATELFLLVGSMLGINEIIVPKKGLSDGIIERLYREKFYNHNNTCH